MQRAFLEAPQELVTALQTMASAHGFQESSMIALLSHGGTLAVQALLTSPEKIAAALALFSENELADSLCDNCSEVVAYHDWWTYFDSEHIVRVSGATIQFDKSLLTKRHYRSWCDTHDSGKGG